METLVPGVVVSSNRWRGQTDSTTRCIPTEEPCGSRLINDQRICVINGDVHLPRLSKIRLAEDREA